MGVREIIHRAQARGGWDHPVGIVAVTKTHGPEAVRAAWRAGLRMVGENRVQEALEKQEATSDVPLEWHLIGSLQRNKVRKVIGRFAMIESIDRKSLIEALSARGAGDRPQPVLVEVNCAGEVNKAGCLPVDVGALVRDIDAVPSLQLRGLMTMAPFTTDREVQRATFRRLRLLRDDLAAAGHDLPELSMGMSGDYAVAVEEGATLVRLGTVLFGERH